MSEPSDSDRADGRAEGLILGLFDGVGSDEEIGQLLALARLGEGVDTALPKLDVGPVLGATQAETPYRFAPDASMADDYTAEEWQIVLELRAMCQDATRQSINKHKRARAIEWLFVPNQDGRKGTRFIACCQALGARPWVVLALVQHLWYLRDIPVGPLPMLAVPLPGPLESEAIVKAWEAGARLAALVWQVPGVDFSTAIKTVTQAGVPHADAVDAADVLINQGMLGRRGTRLYFSARPSHIRRSGRIGWARSFVQ